MTQRILVVANRTAATHRLLDEVKRRASEGSCEFTLHVPPTPGRHPDWTPETARPLFSRAAGRPVSTVAAGTDLLAAAAGCEEAIVSTRASRGARVLRRDAATRLRAHGLRVTVIAARKPRLGVRESAELSLQADAALLANTMSSRDLPR
jgi:hypothetical protein